MESSYDSVGGDGNPGGDATYAAPPGGAPERLGWIWTVVNALLFLGVSVMLLTVGAQVVSRYLNVSLTWTEELTRLIFQAMMFLGMAAGFRTAAHPRVALLVSRGPAWLKKTSAHLYAVAGVAFFVVLLVMAWKLMMRQISTGESSPALGVDMYLVTIPLMVSAVLAILAHIQTVYFSTEMRRTIEEGEITA